MNPKAMGLIVALLATAYPVFAQEKMADVADIEATMGKDWATMSKGLEGFDLRRARLRDNRVTVSQGRATFYLSGDVAEAIYHQMEGKPNPKGAGCFGGLGKSLSGGGLHCSKIKLAKANKDTYVCLMDVDFRTGRLSDEDSECDDEDQEELDRIGDKKGRKYPRLPFND